MKPTVVLATHNQHKRSEFQVLLPELELKSAGELGLPEPDETGSTFQENALIKAQAAAVATGLPALADDSGIAVRGLDGAPGIYSARWAEPGGDFNVAMKKIIDDLGEKYGGFDKADRHAEFIASLCLCFDDGAHCFFDGIVEGQLQERPKGDQGFGYDPLFRPTDQSQTFGEMSPALKNQLSHRFRAIRLLQSWLCEPSTMRDRLLSGN